MTRCAECVEHLLKKFRLTFNIKAVDGKSRELKDSIFNNWIKYNEYLLFFYCGRYLQTNTLNSFLKKTGRTLDEVIHDEVEYLKGANLFLTDLIRYSPYGKDENINQRWYNHLMIRFLETIKDRSHPFFSNNYNLNKKPDYDENLVFHHILNNNSSIIKLRYSADPKYLINGFTYLIKIDIIELNEVEAFVYSNFNFSSKYNLPNSFKKYNFIWKSKVKSSFPQLLGQLKEKRNITSTYEEISDFVLQYIKIARDSAYQYATQKQKLSKNNLIDYKPFTPDSRYQNY